MNRQLICALLFGASLFACTHAGERSVVPVEGIPSVDAVDASIERIIFLVGDAGQSPPGSSPLLLRVGEEVETWSQALAADSAVTVVFLGDNVYPNGMHGETHPDRGRDSLRLANQMDVVNGPMARSHGSTALFIAGNHDWGGRTDGVGASLLQNQEALIHRRAQRGSRVDLLPPATDPGPEVVDLGSYLKLVAVDSQWWLGNTNTLAKSQALRQLKRAVHGSSEQVILFATHHPLASGGEHGGSIPFWPSLGTMKLLHLAGANGQDLSALPYQEMIRDFKEAFAASEAPVIQAAGHEHGLQVIRGSGQGEPDWILVSGSGSKTTEVQAAEGTTFRSSAPGFMRLLVDGSGKIILEVAAQTPAGFETLFAHRLH